MFVLNIRLDTNIVKKNKSLRQSTGLILLDIEKAFDSIWYKGLIYKMHKLNFPLYLVKLTKSFLSERTLKVSSNDTVSNKKPIRAGVPEEAVLLPTLNSIYISDFAPQRDCNVAFYWDDSAIISKSKLTNTFIRKLEKGLKACNKYYAKWKIKVVGERN